MINIFITVIVIYIIFSKIINVIIQGYLCIYSYQFIIISVSEDIVEIINLFVFICFQLFRLSHFVFNFLFGFSILLLYL